MEWAPEKTGLPYAVPAAPRQWLDTLGLSISLFLAEKQILAQQQLAQVNEILSSAAAAATTSEAASLADRCSGASSASRTRSPRAKRPTTTQALACTRLRHISKWKCCARRSKPAAISVWEVMKRK